MTDMALLTEGAKLLAERAPGSVFRL